MPVHLCVCVTVCVDRSCERNGQSVWVRAVTHVCVSKEQVFSSCDLHGMSIFVCMCVQEL